MVKSVFTVSQLNQFIKDVLNAAFPQPVWICGEIQEYDRSRNKNHIFFKLIEKDEVSQTIVAKADLVLFGGRKAFIEHTLKKAENAFELTDDIEVKFSCKVDYYPPHGAVRLVVESIDPTYTLGKLAQQRQKLIAQLKKRGVLDKNKKLPLPLVPLNVGLITSDNSAAYNDFISELNRSQIGFNVYLRNALMQGKKAEADVCAAMDDLQRIKNLDVIVITRGGGSLADLADFDSQKIAEKVADSRLPVLSGIGHEINNSITDMAAHTYAKTPTAIAQFLVDHIGRYNDRLDQNFRRLTELSQQKFQEEKNRLKDRSVRLQNGTRNYLQTYNKRLIEYTQTIQRQPSIFLQQSRRNLSNLRTNLVKASRSRIDSQKQRLKGFIRIIEVAHSAAFRTQQRELNEYQSRLVRMAENRITAERLKLKNFDQVVAILHPNNTLKRGFSITRTQDGQLIRQAKDIKVQQQIVTEFVSSIVTSEVKSIKETEGE